MNEWIKSINIKKNVPVAESEEIVGRVCTSGSYRLGVHMKDSDLDIVILAPRHITRKDFFSSFKKILQEQKEVEDLLAVTEAYVPVMKMKFNGIDVDLLFSTLALNSIPDNIDLKDSGLLKNLDPKCVRSLNGCRMMDEILNLVENQDNFRLALKAIKLWAKRQGVYSNALGYLGGASWAILVAKICQWYPNASAGTLVEKFFFVFSQWSWPNPIYLKKPEPNYLKFDVWDPRVNVTDRLHLMPIITPCYPHQNSAFNVNQSTRAIIEEAIKKGRLVTEDIMTGKEQWDKLFKPINFFCMYKHFIMLTTVANTEKDHMEWHAFVKSNVRILVHCLEKSINIEVVHVYPVTLKPVWAKADTFQSVILLGIWFVASKGKNIDLTEQIQTFYNSIFKKACKLSFYKKDDMTIQVNYVPRKGLSKYLPISVPWKNKAENDVNDSNRGIKRSLDDKENDNSNKKHKHFSRVPQVPFLENKG